MSLTTDYTGITNYKEVCWNWHTYDSDRHGPFEEYGEQRRRVNDDGTKEISELNVVTQTLVFMTIAVGIGRITEETAGEFFARAALIERLDGPFMHQDGKPRLITEDDVIDHIGLRTNVSMETRTKWTNRVVKRTMDEASVRTKRRIAAKKVLA